MQNFDKENKLRYSLPFPSLLQAVAAVQKYSFGATYRGQICSRKRCGVGVFSWPSGETYVGEFDNNKRDGKG